MGLVTFVVEYEDGREPAVHAHMDVLGGKVCSVGFHDYRDTHFTREEVDIVIEALDNITCDDIDHEVHAAIISKMESTQK